MDDEQKDNGIPLEYNDEEKERLYQLAQDWRSKSMEFCGGVENAYTIVINGESLHEGKWTVPFTTYRGIHPMDSVPAVITLAMEFAEAVYNTAAGTKIPDPHKPAIGYLQTVIALLRSITSAMIAVSEHEGQPSKDEIIAIGKLIANKMVDEGAPRNVAYVTATSLIAGWPPFREILYGPCPEDSDEILKFARHEFGGEDVQ